MGVIMYPFLNVNGTIVEVGEWVLSNFNPRHQAFDSVSMLRLKSSHFVKRGSSCLVYV